MTLYTEKEARKRWCPHAVASHTDPRRGFHEHDDDYAKASPPHGCIASACMAWRFGGFRDSQGTEATSHVELDGALTRIGFCGLSGKP